MAEGHLQTLISMPLIEMGKVGEDIILELLGVRGVSGRSKDDEDGAAHCRRGSGGEPNHLAAGGLVKSHAA